jgi:hypothetical protein
LTKRRALSSVGAAVVVSIALALGVWAALGAFVGFGTEGLGAGRGLVLIAVGVFALTMAAWSRLRRKTDSEL